MWVLRLPFVVALYLQYWHQNVLPSCMDFVCLLRHPFHPFMWISVYNVDMEIFFLYHLCIDWMCVLRLTSFCVYLITMLTLKSFTFMYRLYVSLESTSICIFLFTMLTLIYFTSMYGLYVSLETNSICKYLFTMLTMCQLRVPFTVAL